MSLLFYPLFLSWTYFSVYQFQKKSQALLSFQKSKNHWPLPYIPKVVYSLANTYVENRTFPDRENLNEFYRNALIATEDIRFYQHRGIDNRSLLRVFLKTLMLQDATSGGGSTITQQPAKNQYPIKDYAFFSVGRNKLREMVIAKRPERIYNKVELLLLYLNTVPFGERVFGLGTASQRFFGKAPKDLLPEEAAALVGLLNPLPFTVREKTLKRLEKNECSTP